MKFKVIRISSLFIVFSLLALTIISTVTISHIGVKVSNTTRKLPIYSVETDEKKIAITFDAAWSAEDTDELIEILKKHNAKATIFAVGDWVEKNPDAVKKFHKNGHEMANHSDTHAAFSKISREEIKQEILNCNKKIEAITGVAPRLVRAPSGDYDNKSIEVADSLGMKTIQWDCDSLDWKLLSVDEMYNRVVNKVQNGSIVLFHNGVENTPEALDKILTKLQKDGYEFVTVSELIYWDNYEIDHTGRQIKA
ncbi:MAG: polysaccharide deacetylase family protein [Clostridia bacterium]|nr:polysaccharide deacetylase family protein [Clostridia bacterium]